MCAASVQYWSTTLDVVMAGFIFVSSGLIGRLADSYGRRRLAVGLCVLSLVPNCLLLLGEENMWP